MGFVRSSHALANTIGAEVLAQGGNAVDAAVAVGYALAVVHPAAGNLGGGGFAVIHLAGGTDITLDFREKAPRKATRDMFLDSDGSNVIPHASTLGYKAAGVPGSVAGMSAMLEKFGTRTLAELIAPAIPLAENGFRINSQQEGTMAEYAPDMALFASSRKYFLKADGSPYKEGDLLVQKDLAKSLRAIAEQGPDAFYKGDIAELIAKDMRANGGIIDMEDLAEYSLVWRKPLKGTYRGYDIVTMGPPSSGGAHMLQILNIMELENIAAMGRCSPKTIHLMAEAMRYAFADRSEYMGDPDFIDVPLDMIIAKSYARDLRIKIKLAGNKATPSAMVRPGLEPLREGCNTTHYSVVDKWDNAVAITYTINKSYGSAAAIDGAGFLLNNNMDDFAVKPGVPNFYGLVGNEANHIEPGKRPLSSMAPTVILKNGRVFMLLGTPGGSRIITTNLQVISNVIDHGMNISDAVVAPRFHMQWLPDELRVEKDGLSQETAKALTAMGYTISVQPPMGDVNAILANLETGILTGAGDWRGEF